MRGEYDEVVAGTARVGNDPAFIGVVRSDTRTSTFETDRYSIPGAIRAVTITGVSPTYQFTVTTGDAHATSASWHPARHRCARHEPGRKFAELLDRVRVSTARPTTPQPTPGTTMALGADHKATTDQPTLTRLPASLLS